MTAITAGRGAVISIDELVLSGMLGAYRCHPDG
jgi:hypothetical protein